MRRENERLRRENESFKRDLMTANERSEGGGQEGGGQEMDGSLQAKRKWKWKGKGPVLFGQTTEGENISDGRVLFLLMRFSSGAFL